jgi:hypothetical protein
MNQSSQLLLTGGRLPLPMFPKIIATTVMPDARNRSLRQGLTCRP